MVDKYVPQVQTCVRCGADELLGMTIHPSNHGEWVRVADYDTLAATLKVVQDTSIAHAGKQNDRIRSLEAELADLRQFRDWAHPQITQHGIDQDRIRELKAALRACEAEVGEDGNPWENIPQIVARCFPAETKGDASGG